MRLGPGSGQLVIRTRREGLAARVGHDLTIDVTRWSAEVVPGGDDLSATTVTATIALDSFAVREGTGGAMPLTAKDRGEIDTTMRRILGTGEATFTSTRVLPQGDGGVVEGALRLNGVDRPVRLQVVRDGPDRYRGAATVTQSDFGIKPYSAFLGALKLRDAVEVEFQVDLSTAQQAGAA
ncbi:MAG TPA: YceI family protein [Rugosimonospora sp.]|nr:YceI family protein [Rugosimonospora sp.]